MPPRKKRRSSGSRIEDSDLTTKKFAESEIEKWGKMDKRTVDFLVGILDEEISKILTNCKKDQYAEIDAHLKECKLCMVRAWKEMKTPKNTFGSYKDLHKLNASYSSTLSDLIQHEEDLENAILKAKKSCKETENELEKREKYLEEDITGLHPLLRADVQSVLDIPTIPRLETES